MTTKFSICSEALIALDANTISNFDIDPSTGEYDSKEKKVAATRYESIKRDELSNYLWNFNTTTFELSRELATPVTTNWRYQYALPPNFLRLLRVVDQDGAAIGYREEGGKILCNDERVFAVYQRDLGESEFDNFPHFHSCLVARLTAEFSEPITGDGAKIERAWRLYREKRQTAKRIDAQSNPPRVLFNARTSGWRQARVGR